MKAILFIRDAGGYTPLVTISGINGRDHTFRWDKKRSAHVRTYDLEDASDAARFRSEQSEVLGKSHHWPIFVDFCEGEEKPDAKKVKPRDPDVGRVGVTPAKDGVPPSPQPAPNKEPKATEPAPAPVTKPDAEKKPAPAPEVTTTTAAPAAPDPGGTLAETAGVDTSKPAQKAKAKAPAKKKPATKKKPAPKKKAAPKK